MAIVLLHGGAWNVSDAGIRRNEQDATRRSCDSVILEGASALNIVESAVAAQELEEALDAGIGSSPQLDGRIRMDAGICDSCGKYGAVLQIENTSTPIKVARRILEYSYHSILSGEGARQFATEQGLAMSSPYTTETVKEFLEARTRYPELTYKSLVQDMQELNRKKLGTVGAVAMDDAGNLAAACSTGGLEFGYPGRVGDTAIFGAGIYCSSHVAVACTGEGDKILRRLTARRVEDAFLESGDLKSATDKAVQDLIISEQGLCGVIALASDGQASVSHSTDFMSTSQRQS